MQHLVSAAGDDLAPSGASGAASSWQAEDSLVRVAATRAALWRERHGMSSDADFAYAWEGAFTAGGHYLADHWLAVRVDIDAFLREGTHAPCRSLSGCASRHRWIGACVRSSWILPSKSRAPNLVVRRQWLSQACWNTWRIASKPCSEEGILDGPACWNWLVACGCLFSPQSLRVLLSHPE